MSQVNQRTSYLGVFAFLGPFHPAPNLCSSNGTAVGNASPTVSLYISLVGEPCTHGQASCCARLWRLKALIKRKVCQHLLLVEAAILLHLSTHRFAAELFGAFFALSFVY
jgi:hypothetical protein